MSKELLMPLEWHTEQRRVTDLIPYEFNPRNLSDDEKVKLTESIQKFNLAEIPVIDIDNVVIAGHQRLAILFELGRGEELIDVRVPNRKLTLQEFKEYNLRSNILNGEWDFEKIKEHFAEVDLENIGFDMGAFDEFMSEITQQSVEEEGEFDDSLPEDPVSCLGDVFEFRSVQKGLKHRLICGDSTKSEVYSELFGDEKIDLLVTDPPYNVNYEGGTSEKMKIKNDNMASNDFYKFLLLFFKNTFVRMRAGAPAYVFYSDQEAVNFRQSMLDAGFKLSSVLIWVKNQFVLGRLDYHMKHEPILFSGTTDTADPVKTHEPIMYGWNSKGKHPWYSDRKQSSVLEFDRPTRNADHPTMKPLDLLGYLIQNSSRSKDLVADMFFGSGSTMIACEKNWRNCFGCEFDPKFVDVIVRRYFSYMENNGLEYEIWRNGEQLSREKLKEFEKELKSATN